MVGFAQLRVKILNVFNSISFPISLEGSKNKKPTIHEFHSLDNCDIISHD